MALPPLLINRVVLDPEICPHSIPYYRNDDLHHMGNIDPGRKFYYLLNCLHVFATYIRTY